MLYGGRFPNYYCFILGIHCAAHNRSIPACIFCRKDKSAQQHLLSTFTKHSGNQSRKQASSLAITTDGTTVHGIYRATISY